MKITYITIIVTMYFCNCNQPAKAQKILTVEDIEIFKDTGAWTLAQAVKKGNLRKMEEELSRDSTLANVTDPHFDTTLLMWAVAKRRYRPSKILLEYGANPNIISPYSGTTAMFDAISFGWHDKQADKDPKYVKLLLDHGADPNIVRQASEYNNDLTSNRYLESNLMHTEGRGIEKARLLIQAGADINYKKPTGETVAMVALMMKDIELSHLLIVENNAKVTFPEYLVHWGHDNPMKGQIDSSRVKYPVDYLLNMTYEISSPEYRLKMEIVDEFARQGADYQAHKENISKHTLQHIKKLYPNNWETYIKEY